MTAEREVDRAVQSGQGGQDQRTDQEDHGHVKDVNQEAGHVTETRRIGIESVIAIETEERDQNQKIVKEQGSM